MTASFDQLASLNSLSPAPTSPTEDAELTRAMEAFVALVGARSLVHRLQRDVVLGMADDDALDSALMAYRRARSVAARWRLPAAPLEPSSAQRFASWLTETLHAPEMQAEAA